MVEGKRRAGAAVVDGKSVIWSSSLPEGTLAQKGELIALTQVLRLAEARLSTSSRIADMLLPRLMSMEQSTDSVAC